MVVFFGFFFSNVFPDASVGCNCEKNSDIQWIRKYYLTETNQRFQIICVWCQDYVNSFQLSCSVWGFGFPPPCSVKQGRGQYQKDQCPVYSWHERHWIKTLGRTDQDVNSHCMILENRTIYCTPNPTHSNVFLRKQLISLKPHENVHLETSQVVINTWKSTDFVNSLF